MKKTFTLIIVCLSVLLVTACTNHSNEMTEVSPTPAAVTPMPQEIKEEIIIEKFPLQSSEAHVGYSKNSVIVQLSGMSDQNIQNKINRTLQAYADEELAQALIMAEENLVELEKNKQGWFDTYGTTEESFFFGHINNQFEVTYLSPHIVSILSSGDFSMMPEAHPLKKKQAFVFDLQSGDRLQVKDALLGHASTEAAFKELVRNEIQSGKLRPEGAADSISDLESFMNNLNSEAFWIQEQNEQKIMTLFEEAIYAIGFYELDLTQESLGDLADPNAEIWK